MFLDFQAHTITTVDEIEKGTYRVIMRTDDNFFGAEISLDIKLPALNILSADIKITRDALSVTPNLTENFKRLIGVRVGPGMTKIIRSLVGGPTGSNRIADLILDAMEMLINGLTVPELRKAVKSGGESVSLPFDVPEVPLNDVLINEEMIHIMAANPRLKNSCAAFKIED